MMIGSQIPNLHYHGIQTKRAVENYDSPGIPFSHYPCLVHSLVYSKKAAAVTNPILEYEKASPVIWGGLTYRKISRGFSLAALLQEPPAAGRCAFAIKYDLPEKIHGRISY